MLAVSTLLSQLTTMQQLTVEREIQKQVAYDSKVLLVFNCMMLGQNKKEMIEECMLNVRNYPKHERPVLNTLQNLFELKPLDARDQMFTNNFHIIHEKEYRNTAEKMKALEDLFHDMKRNKLEQESAPILEELTAISKGTPLYTVYNHLYRKYNTINENNQLTYEAFERLCNKMSSVLNDDCGEAISTKSLIAEYKTIRKLHEKTPNRTAECIMNLAMALLAVYCNQTQLLIEKQWSLDNLIKESNRLVHELPFSIERYYLKNIVKMMIKYANKELDFSVKLTSFTKETATKKITPHNFGLHIEDPTPVRKKRFSNDVLINKFVKKFTTFSIPGQGSLMIRPNQI